MKAGEQLQQLSTGLSVWVSPCGIWGAHAEDKPTVSWVADRCGRHFDPAQLQWWMVADLGNCNACCLACVASTELALHIFQSTTASCQSSVSTDQRLPSS